VDIYRRRGTGRGSSEDDVLVMDCADSP
jgi:hypothetical protein